MTAELGGPYRSKKPATGAGFCRISRFAYWVNFALVRVKNKNRLIYGEMYGSPTPKLKFFIFYLPVRTSESRTPSKSLRSAV